MNKTNAFQLDRDVLCKIIQSDAKINIQKVDPEGDVYFTVDFDSLGLAEDEIYEAHIVQSRMFVNFIGEWLVRCNLDTLTKYLTEIKPQEYSRMLNGTEHGNFGMFISRKRIRFQFHISLVQRILNEDCNNFNP